MRICLNGHQFRKVIHISGVLIPFLAGEILFGKKLMIALMVLGLAVFLVLDILKKRLSRDTLLLVYRENEIISFSIEPLSYIFSVLSLLSLSVGRSASMTI